MFPFGRILTVQRELSPNITCTRASKVAYPYLVVAGSSRTDNELEAFWHVEIAIDAPTARPHSVSVAAAR